MPQFVRSVAKSLVLFVITTIFMPPKLPDCFAQEGNRFFLLALFPKPLRSMHSEQKKKKKKTQAELFFIKHLNI